MKLTWAKVPNTPAVYAIVNRVNGKLYVGSSLRARSRWNKHYAQLEQGTHGNRYLQNAWRKHGKGAFKFTVLEPCDASSLRAREQWWLDEMRSADRARGYNLHPATASPSGYKHSTATKQKHYEMRRRNLLKYRKGWEPGRKHLEVSKNKIGDAHRGKKQSTETRQKLRLIALARPPMSEATKDKLRAHRGWRHTALIRSKLREQKLGRKRNGRGGTWLL